MQILFHLMQKKPVLYKQDFATDSNTFKALFDKR